MDPIRAIRDKIKELEQDLKHWEKVLELAQPQVSQPSTEIVGIEDKVFSFLTENDSVVGHRVKDIALELSLPEAPILILLRKSKKVIQVNKGTRNQRFRLKQFIIPSSKAKLPAPGTQPRKPKNKLTRNRNKILEYLKTHHTVTTGELMKELGVTRGLASRHLDDLVTVKVVQNLGPDLNFKGGSGKGRAPNRYESLIYEQPREAVIHVGEGVREGRRVDTPHFT